MSDPGEYVPPTQEEWEALVKRLENVEAWLRYVRRAVKCLELKVHYCQPVMPLLVRRPPCSCGCESCQAEEDPDLTPGPVDVPGQGESGPPKDDIPGQGESGPPGGDIPGQGESGPPGGDIPGQGESGPPGGDIPGQGESGPPEE